MGAVTLGKPSVPYTTSTSVLIKQSYTPQAAAAERADADRG